MKSMKEIPPTPAEMVEKKSYFFKCPQCENDDGFNISHFIRDNTDKDFGPWSCDECGYEVRGVYSAADQMIRLTHIGIGPAKIKGFALLSLDRGLDIGPLFFAVKHDINAFKEDPLSGIRYLFEEHHCPTNFIPVAGIIDDGDNDAHGLFKYVAWAKKPDNWEGAHDDWSKLFPQTDPNQLIIDGVFERSKNALSLLEAKINNENTSQ